MIIADFKCEDCKNTFTVEKNNIIENFPKSTCPNCNSENTYRLYSKVTFDMAEGKLGNAKNKYENKLIYTPSVYGKYKGIRIK
jgi:putative FmdB family regulatory protein